MPTAASCVVLKPLPHRGEEGLARYFPCEKALVALAKGLEGARWSKTKGCWCAGLSSQRKGHPPPKTTASYAHVSTHRLQNIKTPWAH